MNEEIKWSNSEPENINEFKNSLPTSVKNYLNRMKASLLTTIDKTKSVVDFDRLVSDIDYLFDTRDTSFSNNGINNLEGSNLGSLKVLAIAMLLGMNTQQALKLFGKHYEHTKDTSVESNHPNIVALMIETEQGIDGVIINGSPFSISEKFLKDSKK